MYRILIVEDDAVISRLLAEELARWDFEVRTVKDFADVLGDFNEFGPQLVLMDISLPFFNGYFWCEKLRKVSNVPVIFLSSHTEDMDIVMAMNMGGDDYITKPFATHVLTAKINALLRRTYSYQEEHRVLAAGGAVLDLTSGRLSFSGREAELTKNELRLLATVMERPGEVVSRETLMQKLWDSDSFIDDNTLAVNVNRLRKKLADIGLANFIHTRKGLGYSVDV